MTLRTPPPPVLAGARVVAYAYVDDVPCKKWGALYRNLRGAVAALSNSRR